MMKLIMSIVFVVLGISLFPHSVSAAPTHLNEIGIYMAPNAYGATGTSVMAALIDTYLVLTKPRNVGPGSPITHIGTFECRLNFSTIPPDGLLKISPDNFPDEALNFGDSSDVRTGYLDYIVGFHDPIPIVDESVVLVTITFVLLSPEVIEVYLGPTDSSSVPGQMVFSQDFNNFQAMHPVSGSPEAPVFLFNGTAVATEDASFGSVKALFR